jgi:tetratricopeptide (TPR) repeat protein
LLAATDSPEKKAHLYLSMGCLMEQIKDYESAIKYYSEALSLEPTNDRTWYYINNNLAYCLNHFGRHADAERYCRVAININPDQYNAHKNLGISLEGQGQFADATHSYVTAVHAEAGNARALGHLESLLEKHPQIANQIPDLWEQLSACRKAVEHAVQTRKEVIDAANAQAAKSMAKRSWLEKVKKFIRRTED